MIKPTMVLPEAGGDKAFELLRRAMMEAGKVAVAKTVLGIKETYSPLYLRNTAS